MTGLLALVADALAVGFGCAVTGDVADLSACDKLVFLIFLSCKEKREDVQL